MDGESSKWVCHNRIHDRNWLIYFLLSLTFTDSQSLHLLDLSCLFLKELIIC